MVFSEGNCPEKLTYFGQFLINEDIFQGSLLG
ncbi:hypothetical protein SAMN06272755_0835 [Picosynechococcus sp. OG1]|nr:hypothetical protein SAMN06272755_0835 [Picosynechococcus sp. OG1]SMQ77843.1 hypothetical protein SAMN06272774_0114 [Synechococcus sp. 7002]